MTKYTREEMIESVPQTGFFGHPRGLGNLFFMEFWERFSYYGMRAILLYFMYAAVTDGGLGFDKTTAQSIMSLYGALIYMTGLIGGWMADRLFGSRAALLYGAIFIMLGHLVLAVPSGGIPLFLISMALIIIGTGLLKPNISNVVGGLYHKDDERMDNGFTIFYMSVNMGALVAPLVVGELQTRFGFHVGFGAAAIGMTFALIGYVLYSKKTLGLVGKDVPNPLSTVEKKQICKKVIIVVILLAVLCGLAYMTDQLTFDNFSYFITILGVILPIYYFVMMYRSHKTTPEEKSRLLAYVPLFLAAVMFWSIQEQGASILGAFADSNVQRHLEPLMGVDYTIPAAFFQSINPLFIVLLAPVVSMIWAKMGKRQPSTPIKFSLGLLFAGLSFLLMVYPTFGMSQHTLIHPLWLVASFILCVLGELCLSPVGTSVSVKLAPQAFESQMMSMWFLSSATAQGVNAQLVRLYHIWPESTYFGFLGGLSIILGVIMVVLAPWMMKKMKGIK